MGVLDVCVGCVCLSGVCACRLIRIIIFGVFLLKLILLFLLIVCLVCCVGGLRRGRGLMRRRGLGDGALPR